MGIINNMPNYVPQIDEVIKQYYVYAGTNITPDTFVEFITGVSSQTTTTHTYSEKEIDEDSGNAWSMVQAGRISSTKALFVYQLEEGGDYNSGCCRIVSFSNGTITVHSEYTILSGNSYTDRFWRPQLTMLSSTLALLSYRQYSDDTTAYVMPLVINGNTITLGSTKAITTLSDLDDNKVYLSAISSTVAHAAYISEDGIEYRTITCSGTSAPTLGTAKTISVTTPKINTLGANGSNSILCYENNYSTLYCYKLTGTSTISSTSIGSISFSDNSSWYTDMRLISSTKLAWSAGTGGSSSSTGYCRTQIISLGTSSISLGTRLDVDDYKNTGGIRTTQICEIYNTSTFFALHYRYASAYQHQILKTIAVSGTTLTVGGSYSDGHNDPDGIGLVSLDTDKLVFLNSYLAYNDYISVILLKVSSSSIGKSFSTTTTNRETQVRPTTTSKFAGIALTSGTGGTSTGHKDSVSIVTNRT